MSGREYDTSGGFDEQANAVEVMPPSVLGELERAEVDIQISTAHKYPRSVAQFIKRANSMVCADADIAEKCFYSRPVGKENGKPVFATGESIRLAEIVAACYGNIRVAARITDMSNPHYVRVEGVAHDLESNSAAKVEVIESTVKKDGSPYPERLRTLIAKAALSKAYRDAVFRVVPKAMCRPIVNEARKVLDGGQTVEQRREKAKAWFTKRNVSDARVFAALGVKGWADVGEEQFDIIRGLFTAVSENEITLEEAFPMSAPTAPVHEGPQQGAEPTPQAQSAPVTQPRTRKPRATPQATAPAAEPVATPTVMPQPVLTAPPASGEDNVPFEDVVPPDSVANQVEPKTQSAPAEASDNMPYLDDPEDLIKHIKDYLNKQGLTDEVDFVNFLISKKIAREGQTQLGNLALYKLQNIWKDRETLANQAKAS